mgnify:CR=1 FL=1
MQLKLPELGEGVHEGELVKWKVKPGDSVKFDQSLCEIMTDKATVEIPSAFQGKVAELHVKEGQVVHVGELMLSFEGAAAAASAGDRSLSASGGSCTRRSAAARAPRRLIGSTAKCSSDTLAPAGTVSVDHVWVSTPTPLSSTNATLSGA